MAVSRREIRRLFRQAMQSDSGAISVPFATADEALRFRKACYNFREALRTKERRKRPSREPGQVLTYDIKGNVVGLTEALRLRDKVETEFDCLQFRVIGRELIIRMIAERVLDEERPVHPGVLSGVREMSSSDIEALPPWPLRQIRADKGRFTDRQVW